MLGSSDIGISAKQFKTLLSILLIGFAFFSSIGAWGNTIDHILGVARYQGALHPPQSILISTLYTSAPKRYIREQTLLSGGYDFRLAVIIESDTMPTGDLQKLWAKGVLENTPANQLRYSIVDLSMLMAVTHRAWRKGDHLDIIFNPRTGTNISVNGQLTKQNFSYPFATVLLRSWIGQFPLSSEFKSGLLGQSPVDSGLLQQLAALTDHNQKPLNKVINDQAKLTGIARARSIEDLRNLLKNPANTTETDSTDKAKSAITSHQIVKGDTTHEKTYMAKSKPTIKKPLKAPALIAKNTTSEKPKTSPISKTKTAKDHTLTIEETSTADNTAQQAPPPVPKTSDTQKTPHPVATHSSNQQEAAAKINTIENDYRRKLAKEVRRYQEMPERAYRRQWQGKVEVHVTLNKDGSVSSIDIAKPDKRKIFNQQARDAIERGAPYSKIPDELKLDTYSFSVAFNYRFI